MQKQADLQSYDDLFQVVQGEIDEFGFPKDGSVYVGLTHTL